MNESDTVSARLVSEGFNASHSHRKIDNLECAEGDEQFPMVILALLFCRKLLREGLELSRIQKRRRVYRSSHFHCSESLRRTGVKSYWACARFFLPFRAGPGLGEWRGKCLASETSS